MDDEGEEQSPFAMGPWGTSWNEPPPGCGPWNELPEAMLPPDIAVSPHAANATTAAYHADIAEMHAASLAQWVQYLSGTLGNLQGKLTELEDWKRRALEDMKKLKSENKALKQQVIEEEKRGELPPGLKDEGSLAERFPPGLDVERSSTVTFDLPPKLESAETIPSIASGLISSMSSRSDADLNLKEEGVHVTHIIVDGTEYEHAEWRIGHLSTKLRGCMGRALVSSPFNALGMEDLRLMVYPDGKDAAQGARNRRQKEVFAKKITEGPLEGRLSLKIPNCPEGSEVTCYYKVGAQRRGPFKHNFSENTVSECDDFGVDWLKEVDGDHSLIVSVDFLPGSAYVTRLPPGLDVAASEPIPNDVSVETIPTVTSGLSFTTEFTSSFITSGSRSDVDLGSKEEGVQVTSAVVEGAEYQRAEWRIGHLSTKLRGCMGRALVSSPFNALGLEDLRLMVYPDAKEAAQGPRNRRQKELYSKKISEGPLAGRLSLKIPSCPEGCELQCYYKVGCQRRGPFKHNFSENTVSECDDFCVDWLKELDADHSLTVCVDLLRISG